MQIGACMQTDDAHVGCVASVSQKVLINIHCKHIGNYKTYNENVRIYIELDAFYFCTQKHTESCGDYVKKSVLNPKHAKVNEKS